MIPERIVRRFDLQAPSDDVLAAVARDLEQTIATVAGAERPVHTFKKVHRVPRMTVTLAGTAAAVAQVFDRIPLGSSVMMDRSSLEVLPPLGPSGSRLTAGVPRSDSYPDRRALLRLDPQGAAAAATAAGTGTAPVVVAIVDSGLAVEHPDLESHVWTREGRVVGARCMGGRRDADITDEDGHGTNLAGTILATAAHAPAIKLMPVKFFDVRTQPLAANAADAIHFAVDHDADIIVLSFDLGLGSTDLEAAFQRACRSKALLVVAAGNTGSDNDRYPVVPAAYAEGFRDTVLVVMATDLYDEKAGFSNFGRHTVDLAAPGVEIVSTRPLTSTQDGRRYRRYSGTSAATAHVAGAAALLKGLNRARSAAEIKACLMKSADVRPALKCRRSGRLNLGSALRCNP